jgi:hypothetical protein
MYNSEETKWFNQVLLSYKDSRYGTNGYLRLSTVTSSTDLKTFNHPNLSLSITNNFQKTCSFQHHDCISLIKSFEQFVEAVKSKQPFDSTISRKMKDFQLHFIFFVGNDEPLVRIQIITNETDMVSCTIPFFGYFESFLKILKQFVENYIFIANSFIQTSLISSAMDSINQIPILIRSSLAQLSSGINMSVHNQSVAPEILEEAAKTEMTIKDLDKFVGEGMKNIKVPEIDEAKIEEKLEAKPLEIKSIFIDKVIKGNLKNLESMLTSYATSEFPTEEIAKRIVQESGIDFNPLIGLRDIDRKSLFYISKLSYQTYDKLATELAEKIPGGFTILKYKSDEFSDTNIELAFDLLLLGGYIRTFRRKMEDKLSSRSRESNGVNFHMNFRMFTDPFVFTFLDRIDSSNVKSVISNRYKYFDSIGVFDHYKKYLADHNCVAIDHTDIDWYVSEIIEKVIGKGPSIDELHRAEFEKGTLKLPAENNLNREQIINHLIPLEIELRFGREIDENTLAPEEVMFYFRKKKKSVLEKEKPSDVNNLARFIKMYKDEIPERFRNEFLTFIEGYANKNFEFDDKYPYQEFGDTVIKILHLWKPEVDEKLAKNYNYLKGQYGEMIHTKDTILSLGTSENKNFDANW